MSSDDDVRISRSEITLGKQSARTADVYGVEVRKFVTGSQFGLMVVLLGWSVLVDGPLRMFGPVFPILCLAVLVYLFRFRTHYSVAVRVRNRPNLRYRTPTRECANTIAEATRNATTPNAPEQPAATAEPPP